MTDETIRQHLIGQDDSGREFVMGVYPMLLDETCHFLAADFDRETWREDVAAVVGYLPTTGIFRRPSNDLAPAMALTCGCSSRKPFPPGWRAISARTF